MLSILEQDVYFLVLITCCCVLKTVRQFTYREPRGNSTTPPLRDLNNEFERETHGMARHATP
jgi:hypothetical protein